MIDHPPGSVLFDKQKLTPKTKTITKTMTMTNTFREHHQRVILKICDFNQSWSSKNLFSFNSDKPRKFNSINVDSTTTLFATYH